MERCLYACLLSVFLSLSIHVTAADGGPFLNTFLANEGQWPGAVLYRGRSATTNVSFLRDGLSFSQVEPEDEEEEREEAHGGERKDHHAEPEFIVWNMRFEGMDPAARLIAEQGRPSVLNYFTGGDRSAWVVHPMECERLVYKGVYAGIDAEFRMNGYDLEYDYRVHAGADLAGIRNSYAGIARLSINPAGDLVVVTTLGEQVQRAPVSWQVINGVKQPVQVDFVLHNDSTFGFTARSGYDPAHELIIDPVFELVWASYTRILGGSNNMNYSFANTMDAQGNVYMTGYADDTFPLTPGAYSGPGNVYPEVFVAKFSSDGSTLLYSTYLQGQSSEFGASIAVDALGRAYVTGVVDLNITGITNFPSTPNAYQPVHDDGSDAFLTVLDPNGSSLIYSTFLGGTGSETAFAVALGPTGIAYITGVTSVGGFPEVAATNYPDGQTDVFVAKFDVDQSGAASLLYSSRIGGGPFSQCTSHGIAVDDAGNAYVTGSTGFGNGTFPVTPGAYNTTYATGIDGTAAFLFKLGNTLPATLVYSTFLGAGMGTSVAVHATTGEAFVSGTTYTPQFHTTPGALQAVHGGGTDAFVLRMNAAGSGLIYSTFLGGAGYDQSTDIVANSVNEAYVVGIARNDFPTSPDAMQPELAGGLYQDMWIVQLNSTGTAYGCGGSTYFGGTSDEYYGSFYSFLAPSISLQDHDGVQDTLSINATTHSEDLPTTPGVYEENKVNGIADQPFFLKMSCAGTAVAPQAGFNSAPAPTCTGGVVDFEDTSLFGATSWNWSFPGGSPATSTVSDPQDIAYGSPGTYDVTLVACNAVGCDTITQQITLVTQPPPTVSLGSDTAFCAGGSVIIAATPGFTSYTWQADGLELPDTTASVVVDESGVYTVLVQDSVGCAATDTVEVLLLSTPIAAFSHEVHSVPCGPQEVIFLAAAGANDYAWEFGDGSSDNGPAPVHSYTSGGSYAVSLTVSNGPCSDTVVLPVMVVDGGNTPMGPIVIPNVFTPNGDGKNDCFAPIGLEDFPDCYGLVIFDRWGLEVFTAAHPGACWKGINDRGEPMPDGVYYYLLTLNGGEEHGSVSVLR
ncbi:MAG: gliding motility-associated C-terminal domain-containing protein [Flavobacteriales bacterium]